MKLIDCTGDACQGDYVYFERAIFSGSFRSPKFEGMEAVEGLVVADSYGQKTGQHTFTIETPNGEKIRIKGRNLYNNGTKRKLWENESEREKIIQEKHFRGDIARKEKQERLDSKFN
jgi:hypothetical protein